MERNIQLAVGSVIDWEGRKFKVILDDKDDWRDAWCVTCALERKCNNLPFICNGNRRMDGNNIHFEEIGGAK